MNNVFLAYPKEGFRTADIQALIDQCAQAGGGQVRLTPGSYLTATLYLKSHVELYLDAGAVLVGSDNCADYSNQCPRPINLPEIPCWYDSVVAAVGQTDVAISGEGIIDGVDCYNANGEQQFRGPHGVYMVDCDGIRVQGIQFVRSACYSFIFERCQNISMFHVAVRGGQDGFRFTDCRKVNVDSCDIRSGDDCICGSGNYDVTIANTMLNTPGDASMLFSCVNLHVKGCKIWSACEYPAVFKDDKRYSLCHTGVVHGYESGTFGPNVSDNWLIEDTLFENVQGVYRFEKMIHGREAVPVRNVVLDGVRAVNMVEPIQIVGDPAVPLNLTVRNSSFHFAREDQDCDGTFLRAEDFGAIRLENVRLHGCNDQPILCKNGCELSMQDVVMEKALAEAAVSACGVDALTACETAPATTRTRYAVPGSTSQLYPKDATEEFRGPLRYIPRA